ncbi:hypothetical protein J6590_078714, partial [Homalodisca vitripennis]
PHKGRALTKNWLQTHHVFPSTEIFSRRRKIYSFRRETRVERQVTYDETDQFTT